MTKIHSSAVIEPGAELDETVEIGPYAVIGAHVKIGADMKYRGEPTQLEIGDRNTIREFTTIHTGNHTIFASNAQIAGHVQVGDWAILGGMAGVHQFVRIGAHSMLGGATVLIQDIPPFIMAAGDKAKPHGINLEGLRRRGFTSAAITTLRTAYRTLYKAGLSLEQAKIQLAELAAQADDGNAHVQELLSFIADTQRGIIR
ncbi:hypothetical protein CPC16_004234 [Podila verticillata]|nr:hypothetical protein CPC16_004234 [Podila verticillata]